MEKDFIARIQKQYETYYEKGFNTELAIISTLALFITIVLWLAARFGLGIFDRQIDLALREASAQLRTEFTQQLRTELETLRASNADQTKNLEAALTKRITEQEQDLRARSDYQFQFAQALSLFANDRWDGAIRTFRNALVIYNTDKQRGIFAKHQGERTTP